MGKKTAAFSKKKVDLIEDSSLWNGIKDDPPCSSVEWTHQDEDEDFLKELETEEIEMKDTLLGKENGEMVNQNLCYLENFFEEQQAEIAQHVLPQEEELMIIKQQMQELLASCCQAESAARSTQLCKKALS